MRCTAVQEAAAARLRPILMTSLATVLGILPIALAIGAGSESRVSMGVAVIGGLVCGWTLLTLGSCVPACMYLLLRRRFVRQPQGELSGQCGVKAWTPLQWCPSESLQMAGCIGRETAVRQVHWHGMQSLSENETRTRHRLIEPAVGWVSSHRTWPSTRGHACAKPRRSAG